MIYPSPVPQTAAGITNMQMKGKIQFTLQIRFKQNADKTHAGNKGVIHILRTFVFKWVKWNNFNLLIMVKSVISGITLKDNFAYRRSI